MNVPLLDLKGQYLSMKDEIVKEMLEVCESQRFILGPKVEKLESEVASYCQAPYCCGVTSGSDALIIALMVEGIGAGDEVITTPFTFFATVGAIVRVGAKPVFADIDPVSFNIDPAKIEEKITSKTLENWVKNNKIYLNRFSNVFEVIFSVIMLYACRTSNPTVFRYFSPNP